jgi:hypothetical protein
MDVIKNTGLFNNISQYFSAYGAIERWRKDNQDDINKWIFWMLALHLLMIFARDHTLLLGMGILAYVLCNRQ